MIKIISIKRKIKLRLGELWWYTIVLFVAQQMGTVINAVIGLWLIPKYVPKEELGVVLPLTSISGLLGLPLSILLIPFMKFLSKYMAQEEYGKVKALLRDAFFLAGVTFFVVSGFSYFFMPLVFTRLRVEAGALSLLVICSGMIGALAPIFATALQALKKFRVFSFMGLAGALVRLGTLLVALPIRGLSGYFVGQIVPALFGIVGSLYFLRKYLLTEIKQVSYWSEDMKSILQYVGWFSAFSLFSMLAGTSENFVIRHRLLGIESAAYYMISRFSDIVISLGVICSSVLFPLMVESHEKKATGQKNLLLQSLLLLIIGGVLIAAVMALCAYILFSYNKEWQVYIVYVPHMIVLCIISVMRSMIYCYVMHEFALSRFKFVIPFCVFYASEIVVLYSTTGWSFFASWMPHDWMRMIEVYNPCRLSFIISIMLIFTIVFFMYMLRKVFRNNKDF